MKKNNFLLIGLTLVSLLGAGFSVYHFLSKTPSHSKVIFKYESNPLATIHIIYPDLRSQENIAGATYLTLQLLDHGTPNKDRLALARQAEAIGAQYSFYCSADDGIISLICPAQYLPQAIDFLQELLTQAILPEKEFTKLKNEQLAILEEEATDPFLAGMNINRKLQYPGHYYQTGTKGTTTTVAQIKYSDCQEILVKMQNPEKLLISINGGFPLLATRKSLLSLLNALPQGKRSTTSTLPQKPEGTISGKLPLKTETGLILVNIPAPAIGKDYALYRCLEAYIGRGLSSPLFIRARDLNGIGYKVGALYSAYKYDGLLTLFVQTNQKNKAPLSQKIFDLSVLTKFDALQAQRAREYLRTTDLKNDESTLSRGYKLAWTALHELPSNYALSKAIQKINDQQLQETLKRLNIKNTVIID